MCLIYRIACSVCHRMLLHELYARLIAASTRAATSGLCQSFGQKFDTAQSSFFADAVRGIMEPRTRRRVRLFLRGGRRNSPVGSARRPPPAWRGGRDTRRYWRSYR
jgi:hypothetical protein